MAIALLAVAGESPALTAFLAFTAVVQTVLLAWLATVPRWGAKGAQDDRTADRKASAEGRKRRLPDG